MVRRRFAELDKKNFGVLDEMFARSYRLNLPGMPKALDLDERAISVSRQRDTWSSFRRN